ncbi:hypothetical protein CapIbe_017935 [Capra ibex]
MPPRGGAASVPSRGCLTLCRFRTAHPPLSGLPRSETGLRQGALSAPERPGRGRGWRLLHPPALGLLPRSSPAETTVAGTPFKVSIASPDFGWGKPQGYSRASGVCWKDHHEKLNCKE